MSLLLIALALQNSFIPVIAEDGEDGDYDDRDDYLDSQDEGLDDAYGYEAVAITSSPTFLPTNEPTTGGDDFYQVGTDDGYTAEAQSKRIYYSSVSDVILCLMCTFFWVLWLVGAIFPTKIQHLYRTEGVVVKGYVVESYTSSNTTAQEMEMMDMQRQMDMQMGMDMDDQDHLRKMDSDNARVSKDSSSKNNKIKGMKGDGPDSSSHDFEMEITSSEDEMNIPVYHALSHTSFQGESQKD